MDQIMKHTLINTGNLTFLSAYKERCFIFPTAYKVIPFFPTAYKEINFPENIRIDISYILTS